MIRLLVALALEASRPSAAGSACEHAEIHAGAEVLARGGHDDDAGRRFVVDLAHDARKLGPEGRDNAVQLVRSVEAHVRHLVGDLDVEAGVPHG